mmetsp:Transcript_40298/g.88465  ORF Transcript_40298/g.88465 Transcript_40298/m.88465 type:complete len:226 (-) Transcript_40298:746-1423(-)
MRRSTRAGEGSRQARADPASARSLYRARPEDFADARQRSRSEAVELQLLFADSQASGLAVCRCGRASACASKSAARHRPASWKGSSLHVDTERASTRRENVVRARPCSFVDRYPNHSFAGSPATAQSAVAPPLSIRWYRLLRARTLPPSRWWTAARSGPGPCQTPLPAASFRRGARPCCRRGRRRRTQSIRGCSACWPCRRGAQLRRRRAAQGATAAPRQHLSVC